MSLFFVFFGMLCVVLLTTSIASAAETPYQGVAVLDAPIREEPSTRAEKLGEVLPGELLDVISLEDGWYTVTKEDVTGFVLGQNIESVHSAIDHTLAFPSESGFEPLYTAIATEQLTMREEPSRESQFVDTVYEEDDLLAAQIGDEWSLVRRGKSIGYVLTEYLEGIKAINPYWTFLPDVTFYPYAARITAPTVVTDATTGELLQELPVGATVNVRSDEATGQLYLPYKRTTGVISTQTVELIDVVPYELSVSGEIIGLFSTYFPNDPENDIDRGRLHNLQMGVDLMEGRRIESGARFSFNDIAAPYTKGNGYLEGPIINYVSDKKTGYGGGICQVSTTMYNVLLQLPMRIITTRPHSSVGIDYAPVDYDAAVGNGNLDLIFENMLPFAVEFRTQLSDGVITVMMCRAEDGT